MTQGSRGKTPVYTGGSALDWRKGIMDSPKRDKPASPVYTGKDECLVCGLPFKRLKPNQRFCSGGRCRSIYHNREKGKGLMLTPEIRAELRTLADAHEVTENEMAIRMYHQWTNPQKKPVEYSELYGQNGAKEP